MNDHRKTPLPVPEGYTTLSRLLAGMAEMERAGVPGLRAKLLGILRMSGEGMPFRAVSSRSDAQRQVGR